jgi:hypothetical protein
MSFCSWTLSITIYAWRRQCMPVHFFLNLMIFVLTRRWRRYWWPLAYAMHQNCHYPGIFHGCQLLWSPFIQLLFIFTVLIAVDWPGWWRTLMSFCYWTLSPCAAWSLLRLTVGGVNVRLCISFSICWLWWFSSSTSLITLYMTTLCSYSLTHFWCSQHHILFRSFHFNIIPLISAPFY